ncbi:E3 ubiquitin-protein ligase Midline-1-like [Spea bombifrons]|uniref:E3 ubiquitin-protein ligase Midline-1-like n=1 Tax=Spea bombifrons TaxID=233779 RepID=UPI00234BC43C|nr:E3 ubiquitin-protein ligase Midline-1-like [Spea bombifrons]
MVGKPASCCRMEGLRNRHRLKSSEVFSQAIPTATFKGNLRSLFKERASDTDLKSWLRFRPRKMEKGDSRDCSSPAKKCLYCDAAAEKLCLDCEVFLCEEHSQVHNPPRQHILSELTSPLGSRKCPVHKEIFRYQCVVDKVYVCASCGLQGNHKGHQLEPLSDISRVLALSLGDVVHELTDKIEENDILMEEVVANKDDVLTKAANLEERVTTLFRNIRRELEDKEQRILWGVKKKVEHVSHQVSTSNSRSESTTVKFHRQADEIERLCLSTDPITILEKGPALKNKARALIRETQPIPAVPTLDEILVSVSLQTALLELVKNIPNMQKSQGFPVQNMSHFLLHRSNNRDDDDVQLSSLLDETLNLEASGSNHLRQTFSSTPFSPGQHYWEMNTSKLPRWYAGVSYSRSDECTLGGDCRSWCLRFSKIGKYAFAHNGYEKLVRADSPVETLGIFLHSDAGILSFFQVADEIKHLHTVNATFTEPLCSAFCVDNMGWIRM